MASSRRSQFTAESLAFGDLGAGGDLLPAAMNPGEMGADLAFVDLGAGNLFGHVQGALSLRAATAGGRRGPRRAHLGRGLQRERQFLRGRWVLGDLAQDAAPNFTEGRSAVHLHVPAGGKYDLESGAVWLTDHQRVAERTLAAGRPRWRRGQSGRS